MDHLAIGGSQPFGRAFRYGDPAYAYLNWLGGHGWGGIYFVNTVCALLFVWGLIAFCRAQPRPWLALVVAFPYLVMVVAMGNTRQGVAIGLVMLGLTALMRGRFSTWVWWVAVAALFHRSAVGLMLLPVFRPGRYRPWRLLVVVAATVLLFKLVLEASVDAWVSDYILAEYDSSGAKIRIAMNALPATVFLVFRHRFPLHEQERGFWTWMAWGALVLVGLLILSPSSTAVDRVALYWIPLQLFVWARVPDAMGRPGRRNVPWVYAVVGYSALVQGVWLNFASHAYAWLPYRSYLWEVL